MHIVLLLILLVLSACGGTDATPGTVGQSTVGTTADGGVGTTGGIADAGGTVQNVDAGTTVTCKGTVTLDGVAETYDVPSDVVAGVCDFQLSSTHNKIVFTTAAGTHIEVTRIDDTNGPIFRLDEGMSVFFNGNIPIIVAVTPKGVTTGVPYVNASYHDYSPDYTKAWTVPSGMLRYVYTSTAPGSAFTLNAMGSISGDRGNTYHDLNFHLETVWQ